MKVALESLFTSTGVLAFAAGDEVPDHVLGSDLAKACGWPEKVAGAETPAKPEPPAKKA